MFTKSRPWPIIIVVLATFLGLTVGNAFLPGQPLMSRDADGPVILLQQSEIAFAAGNLPPVHGWVADRQTHDFRRAAIAHGIDPPAIWVRYRFDGSVAADRSVSLICDFIRENFTVYFNGTDIARTRHSRTDLGFDWVKPRQISLPAALLRPGSNELIFHIESRAGVPLAIGMIGLGSDETIQGHFNRQIFFNSTAPEIINGILLVLTCGSLAAWSVRPKADVFCWLGLLGIVWYFRNLHYYIDAPPFENDLFWALTTDSVFVLMALIFAFAATFFDLRAAQRMIGWVTAMAALGIVVRHALVAAGQSDVPSFLTTVPIIVANTVILARAVWRQRRTENILMLIAVIAAFAFAFHDLLLVSQGTGLVPFQLQSFGSLLVFSAFGFALGRRMLEALAMNEDVNMTLERRMAVATLQLERSEEQRRALVVASAVENERERMMREIHDGIGSNLITALAVAEKQQQSPGTIATLRRSITDLRIGVDSLEPINGDVGALLANLRHRMEREVRDAGLSFVWKVEATPPLPWLDPVGALHLLRILQETIGNVLNHAGAQRVEVVCAPHERCGESGVIIILTDDGCGFDSGVVSRGRGLSNMKARAEALSATFGCETRIGDGTRISIWLPLEAPRSGPRRPD